MSDTTQAAAGQLSFVVRHGFSSPADRWRRENAVSQAPHDAFFASGMKALWRRLTV